MLSIEKVIEFVRKNCQRYALIMFVGLAMIAGTQQQAEAQTTVVVGGFQVQFWNQGDNAASGANFIDRGAVIGTVADANLGTWSVTEQAAITRSFQYWSDRLGLPNATLGGNSAIIRVVKDSQTAAFNAFSSNATTGVGTGETLNTANRIINGANPTRVDGVDAVLVFQAGTNGGVSNTWGTTQMLQLSTELRNLETVSVHEIAHSLGFAFGRQGNFTSQFTGTTFTGTTAVGVFGAPVPMSQSHVLINYHNITRATPFGRSFRNISAAAPAELAILNDLGHTITLSQQFGRVDYQPLPAAITNNITAFSSNADYAIGHFIQSVNPLATPSNIIETVNLTASGFAGTGIRLSDAQNNRITISDGVAIQADGEQGIGFLAGSGARNFVAIRGTLSANGVNGRGVVADFGVDLLGISGPITSADFGAPLIQSLDITGTISATTNAIQIGGNANVGQINVMRNNGLVSPTITGNIFSDALIGGALATPVLAFGRTVDANGFAIAVSEDLGFTFTYGGTISGSGPRAVLDIDAIAGITTLNGAVAVQDVEVFTTTVGGARLISNNIFQANNITVNNRGRLDLNQGFTLDSPGIAQIDAGGLITALNYNMTDGTTIVDAAGGGAPAGLMMATNQINVAGGLYTLNGIATTPSFLVGAGGTLMGAGLINGDTTINGTFTPGNSIGTMTINGNLNSSNTAVFNIEAQPNTNAPGQPVPGVDNDRINVTGTAVVNGGTVNVIGAPGVYQLNDFYRFLTTGGGVTVTQTPLFTDNIAGFRAVPFFNANDFGFLIRQDINFGTVARTYNQRSFATYFITAQNNPNPSVQTIRNNLDLLNTDADVRNAIDRLTGDIYASLPTVGINNTSRSFDMLSRQQTNANDLAFSNNTVNDRNSSNDGWFVAYNSENSVDYDGNAAGLDYRTNGSHFGVAHHLNDNSRIGYFGSYGRSNITSDNSYQTARTDNLQLGTFFYHHNGSSFINAAGSVGYDQYKTTRRIAFGALNETARGDFTGYQAAAFFEHGYEFRRGTMRLQPLYSFQYIQLQQGRLQETDGNATNLTVDSLNTQSMRSAIGVNWANDIRMGEKWATAQHLRASLMHEYFGSTRSTTTLSADNTAAFGVKGVDFGSDWLKLGAGLSFAKGDSFVLRFDLNTQLNEQFISYTGTGSFSMLY